MRSPLLFSGALATSLGVAFGAFGAHFLKTRLSPEMLAVYQTGVTYQMWHGLGLILIALIQQYDPASKLLKIAGKLMGIGIILFSGSLYGLALLNLKGLGLVTPLGGVSFVFAWLLLALFAAGK